ncbi:hypothetical protein U1Q18_023459 [Sarracenia purpurea var. burkii]
MWPKRRLMLEVCKLKIESAETGVTSGVFPHRHPYRKPPGAGDIVRAPGEGGNPTARAGWGSPWLLQNSWRAEMCKNSSSRRPSEGDLKVKLFRKMILMRNAAAIAAVIEEEKEKDDE